MSLFGALSVGSSAVNANQLALRVVGNNIANASTEGYVREELRLGTVAPTRYGSLNIGSGTTAVSTQQQIDRYLKERSREAASSYAAAQATSDQYVRLESTFNELTDNDLSTAYNDFFNSIQDVANQPGDSTLRDVVFQKGLLLTSHLNSLRDKVDEAAADINQQVVASASEINETVKSIRQLNVAIASSEAGSASDAGNLRDQRDLALDRLSQLIPIQVHEQADGTVNVLVEGDYLLFNGSTQEVGTVDSEGTNLALKQLAFVDSQRRLPVNGGQIGGLEEFAANDLELTATRLDLIARSTIYEFNKIHSSGQGLQQFTSLEGTYRAIDPSAPLTDSAAGLQFTPNNGSFEILVTDAATGQQKTYQIDVDLDGIGSDDSLQDVVQKIDNIAFGGTGAAQVNAQGRVQINAPAGTTFQFANDTSGFLASFGINTFFTGSSARDIRVSDLIGSDPRYFAVSATGAVGDNSNALAMANLQSTPLDGLFGQSIDGSLSDLVSSLGISSQANALNAQVLLNTKSALESEHLAISGVSLDEEAVKLVMFQRAFQASARYISTINDLLDEVLNLGR